MHTETCLNTSTFFLPIVRDVPDNFVSFDLHDWFETETERLTGATESENLTTVADTETSIWLVWLSTKLNIWLVWLSLKHLTAAAETETFDWYGWVWNWTRLVWVCTWTFDCRDWDWNWTADCRNWDWNWTFDWRDWTGTDHLTAITETGTDHLTAVTETGTEHLTAVTELELIIWLPWPSLKLDYLHLPRAASLTSLTAMQMQSLFPNPTLAQIWARIISTIHTNSWEWLRHGVSGGREGGIGALK
jgi:hypothetical protein